MHGSMIPVLSSNIDGYRYLEERSLLLIAFKGGTTYAYENVPISIVSDFTGAPSKGRFFGQRIKNVFPCTKLDQMAVENVLAAPLGVRAQQPKARRPSLTFDALQVKYPALAAMF